MTFLSASATCANDRLLIRGDIHNRTDRTLYVQDRPVVAHPCAVDTMEDGFGANGSWLVSSGALLVVVGSTSLPSPPEGLRYPTPSSWPQPGFTRVPPGARHPLNLHFRLPITSHNGGGSAGDYRPPEAVRPTAEVWLVVHYEWPVDSAAQEQGIDGSTAVWLREPTRVGVDQALLQLPQPIAAEDPGVFAFWGDAQAQAARGALPLADTLHQLGISVRE